MNLRQGISAKRKESIFSPWQLFLREILFRCRKVSFFLRMVAKRFYNGFLLLPLGHLYNKEKNCEPKTSFFRRTSMTDKIPDEIQTSLLNRGLRQKKKKNYLLFLGLLKFSPFYNLKILNKQVMKKQQEFNDHDESKNALSVATVFENCQKYLI